MKNAIYYVSYKLKKGASVDDFLLASKQLNNQVISKQPGYLSWQQLNEKDVWVDLVTFETMADLNNFIAVSHNPNQLALDFYSFINLNSCKQHFFNIERSY